MSARSLVFLIVLLAGVVGLQAAHEHNGGRPASTTANMLYVRSPDAMKRLALSYDSLLADLYWVRAIQHYGTTRLSTDAETKFDLLYPLLDLTTSLDPRFTVAYYFGSLFLAEPPPGGPGRPDLAIALLEKGLDALPERWELAQSIGFVHYWWRQDYEEAAAWFGKAAEFPNAPIWMAPLAAVTMAEGGSRDSSRLLWRQIAQGVEDKWFRNEAARRLQQLDAMDHLDSLAEVVSAFEQGTGRTPSGWDELWRGGYLPGMPVDPAGVPYRLDSGVVGLGPGSPLSPLPTGPAQLQ
jgi:TPR repeat protein